MYPIPLRTGSLPLLRRFLASTPATADGRRLFPTLFAAARNSSSSVSSLAWNVSIAEHGISITPKSTAAAPKRSTFHNLWLRDSCRCKRCVNQDTLQRNFNTFDLPKDHAVIKAEPAADGLKVIWSDGHESSYPWSFIHFYQENDARQPEDVKPKLWGAEIVSGPEADFEAEGISLDLGPPSSIPDDRAPVVSYSDVMDESGPGIGRLTKYIRKFGFVFVTGTPPTPEATEKVLERIAFIRITHYGGFYDFIPDLAMADTAYTNIALPAHTDTTYFSDPAGLQAFHMLSHSAPPDTVTAGNDGKIGGESLLVDGFHAAAILKQENPEAYQILSRVRLPWHASGNRGINIAPDMRYPVLELHPQTGELHRVRWNNDDRGVVPFDGPVSPETWFEAAKHWQSILRRKEMELWTQLTPGKILIFDNWRVLHGRAAFVGIRRICGGYTNRDDFMSRWRNTNYPREEIMKQVVG